MDLYNCLSIVYIISDLQDNKLALDILNSLELEEGVVLHSSSIYHMLLFFLERKNIPQYLQKNTAYKSCIEWFQSFLKSESFDILNKRKSPQKII
ncbi:hypothetical protein HMPREF9171_0135 [Streptococcus agalactiae ATCC 13813]|uniref:Transposase n=2 Tax=Streptococcus agalactiae TaxID=1311 RepID=A0A0H1UFQ3_STRAG|nr:hypothetical protein HMPREF9171_0135 [Streptococcus agalactiae ATCC 13813]EPU34741.1 hypothetical protein SAG0161_06130 [Streptococcus agalactiae MRI Z1-213]EPU35779.1 hypothetical protein SAG0162_03220 [Streptococcus agalactiae MRI Z1-214]EPU38989.1 hypothetical protein SAG0164_04070 [Streptococcus agalactiae MRI Z1-216]EPU42816.1 hypothetical protein SAG0170_05690 [Streptococcus agalactiae LDS 617]EPV82041.1 hypothetical protein SAG0007_01280 [Streptococcus agalactiae FSL C1-487]KLL28016